jgi:DNA/RNA-binding domain of Phe-tRNA-synthetase-like protein
MNVISISNNFLKKWPSVKLGCISCNTEVKGPMNEMWNEIDTLCETLKNAMQVEQISQLPAINASRKAYRALGKDPARYRLSAEALMRRVLKGGELYRFNNLVDMINLISIKTGFSIGGYDADKIDGDVSLSVGSASDVYEALGRGVLNIEWLPVLRDNEGAFGSPTSDSVRTGITMDTKRFLMVIFGFGAHDKINDTMKYAEQLLMKYAEATTVEKKMITP